ncbi:MULTISPECIES: hypothetical protein [Amycolatopsis]|uniref:hypothetical protein n=1 Tax=Amycolatopsis TaxID=1813 RepID=UPI001C55F322|nr:hypothetical protein [Amycolatopsis sp. TNS106]
MTSTELRLRTATANVKRAGYDRATRFHDHDKLAGTLRSLKETPHAWSSSR